MSNILKLENLSVGYRIKDAEDKLLIKNINTVFEGSELIALIGANGKGKTSLIRTIIGLNKKLSGNIFLNNEPLENMPAKSLAKLISYVSTGYINLFQLSVFTLVAQARFPYTNFTGSLSKYDKSIIEDSLNKVGMLDFKYRMINSLSDGERQRVLIARALAQNTPIIILDEPTAFLDLANKYSLINLLNTLCRKQQKTILFSSHDLNIVIREVDKICLVNNYKLNCGAPEDLALTGILNEIFPENNIIFDKNEGDFKRIKEKRDKISISGKGHALFWLKRALERLSFTIEETKNNQADIRIEYCDKILTIKYLIDSKEIEFNSIYNLCNFLTHN